MLFGLLGIAIAGGGGGGGGGGPSAPAWVLEATGDPATMQIDWDNDRAWLAPSEVSISSLLSCSRASSKYLTSASGVLTSIGNNVLPYNDAGLSVEAAGTNLWVRSQELDDDPLAAFRLTVSPNQTAAPDGTTTADLLVEDSTTDNRVIRQSASALSGAHVFSAYVKAAVRTQVGLSWGSGLGKAARFNLSNGSVAESTGCTAGIVALANGWFRIWIAVTAATENFAGIYPLTSAGTIANNFSYAANGSNAIYAWGVQIETGAQPSSYIPTGASSASRAADVITFSDLTWFDGSADSVYAQWVARNVANSTVLALDAANNVLLTEQSGMSPRLADAGTSFTVTTANTALAGTTVAAAGRMATNDIALCMGGGTVATDTSATQPGTLTAARVGCDLSGANHLNSTVKRMAVWKNRLLSNAELQVFL